MADEDQVQVSRYAATKITRHDFPKDFVFGCATSAYQVEGAYDADGKSMSNWDAYTLRRPECISDGSNGCIAIDHYNKYKEDVLLMKKLGLDAYRFSISWSRVLPGGRLSSGVNKDGVKYYNDLIDFCLDNEIEPYVTLFHFELPQCLEDEYGGFLSPKIVQDFGEFAELCFWEFGDRVKHWITLNEPWTFSYSAYVAGTYPPGRGVTTNEHLRSLSNGAVMHRGIHLTGPHTRSLLTNSAGDPGTEPYIAAHHLILSHASAVDIYRKQFQAVQGGKIGITNMSNWFEPLNDTEEDKAAAQRAVDFMWGWFMSPIVHGDYPPVMRKLVGKRLPTFTPEETKLIQGSYDFIGLNYYTTNYVTSSPTTPPNSKPSYKTDQQAEHCTEKNGIPIGEKPGSIWFFIVPRGIYGLLVHTKDKYNDPLIYITENGMSEANNNKLTVTEARKDDLRVSCYQDHLTYTKQAIEYGVNVKAYFLWSMFDNYEWAEGYTARFGIFYIDFANRLARHPKASAFWWMNFLNKNLAAPVARSKRQVKGSEEQYESVKRVLKTGKA
ncbi:hypothetical protein ACJIZ3_018920 [Penstemon smallii]|uniref:Beta-glucosidase n=1 Tax=Penstemon smallii TaxID=265156 RepID=A0ABD3T163_9LAMI